MRKQWEQFKSKSIWGKLSDLLFVVLIITVISGEGRVFLQRMVLQTGMFGSVSSNESVSLESEAYEWVLHDVEGHAITLAHLKGKTVFLNYWATWCPPCNAEMPGIIELMQNCSDEVAFVFASNETPEKVKKHLDSKGWKIPAYIYAAAPPSQLSHTSLPTTLVIDKHGKVIHRSEGMRKWNSDDARALLGCEL